MEATTDPDSTEEYPRTIEAAVDLVLSRMSERHERMAPALQG